VAEPIQSKLAIQSKPIVPLLEELTYFLEQYYFSPSLLSQNVKALARQITGMRLIDDDFSSSDERSSSSNSKPSGPAYDYDTLCMIMAEAHSFGLSLKIGLSTTAWLSAVASINGAALQWLSQLYRIPSHLTSAFVDDLQLTRQNILRTALLTHFPSYNFQGYRAFGASNPLVLCTHFVPWIATLISDIGLPQDCIRVGPKALEQLSSDDVVVAVFWVLPDPTDPITWNDAQTDSLISFVQNRGVWLHAEGYDTILMSSLPNPAANVVAQIADSLIVDASELLQVDRFPSPTIFYRTIPRTPSPTTNTGPSSATIITEPLALVIQSDVLHLELWFATQLKGYHFLSNIVSTANSLCDILYRRVGVSQSFRILESGDKSNTKLHIRYEYPFVLPQSNASTTYTPTTATSASSSSEDPQHDETTSTNSIDSPPSSFCPLPIDDEKVTEYLFRFVQNSSPTPLPLELKRLNADGKLYIVWNPLRCYHLHHLARGHVHSFSDLMTQQATIISSTMRCREVFETEVSKFSSLALVNTIPLNFVGLGAVRYRPEFVSSLEEEVGKQAQRWAPIIDDLNLGVLNEVLQIHPLYYAATTNNGERCIGIHLDSSEMTPEKVQYHIQLILETATRIETELHFLDRIGDLVKEGIKEAQEAIQRSSAERVSQKGIVRALPIVGRVWNWWSPYKSSTNGTTFDLLTPKTEDEK
jgi:hypothetical protein